MLLPAWTLSQHRPFLIFHSFWRVHTHATLNSDRDEVRVDAVAGSVRQDEIERLRSPAIINHDSYHFVIITAVDVVFDERLRSR